MEVKIIEIRELRSAERRVCKVLKRLTAANSSGGLLAEQDGKMCLTKIKADVWKECGTALPSSERCIWNCFMDFQKKMEERFCQGTDEWMYFACVLLENLLSVLIWENPVTVRRNLQEICQWLLDGAEQNRCTPIWEYYCRQVTDDSGLSGLLEKTLTETGVTGCFRVKKSDTGEDHFSCHAGHFYPQKAQIKQEESTWKNPYVVISTLPVKRVEEILLFMTVCAREGRPLILVVEYMEEAALQAFRYNILHGGLRGTFFLAHKYGTERELFLRELAFLCGAIVIDRDNGGFEAAGVENMGTAEAVVCEEKGGYFYTQKREAELRRRIEAICKDGESVIGAEREELLTGKVVELSVGGIGVRQEQRLKELKLIISRMEMDRENGLWQGGNPAEYYLRRLEEYGECNHIVHDAVKRALECMRDVGTKNIYSYRKETEGLRMACSFVGELVTMEMLVNR